MCFKYKAVFLLGNFSDIQFDQKWPSNSLFYIFAPFIPCEVVTLYVTTTYGTYHCVNGVKQNLQERAFWLIHSHL